MRKEHHVVFVAGLSGVNPWFIKMVNAWGKYGFVPHVYDINWQDSESFELKNQKFLNYFDNVQTNGSLVSLVGVSAGGSAVLNAHCDRKESVHRVVNICGRLKAGTNTVPNLEFASRKSTSFYESVTLFESREPMLSENERKQVLTTRALFDEVVPTSTTILTGAENRRLLSVGHMPTIAAAMTVYSRPIAEFIKNLQG